MHRNQRTGLTTSTINRKAAFLAMTKTNYNLKYKPKPSGRWNIMGRSMALRISTAPLA